MSVAHGAFLVGLALTALAMFTSLSVAGLPHRALSPRARHDHGSPEAWVDVILGTFDAQDFTDHVSFGCRVGPVAGQAETAASLVAAATPYGPSPMFGQKLSRDSALVHPWLPAFWNIVDFLLIEDPDVHRHVYS